MRSLTYIVGAAFLLAFVLTNSAYAHEDEAAADPAAMPQNPYAREEPLDPIVPITTVTEAPAPSEPHPYAIFLSENSCKLRKQYTGVRAFINTDLPY